MRYSHTKKSVFIGIDIFIPILSYEFMSAYLLSYQLGFKELTTYSKIFDVINYLT